MVVPSTTSEVKDCLILFRFNYLPHDTIVLQQGVLRHIKKNTGMFSQTFPYPGTNLNLSHVSDIKRSNLLL